MCVCVVWALVRQGYILLILPARVPSNFTELRLLNRFVCGGANFSPHNYASHEAGLEWGGKRVLSRTKFCFHLLGYRRMPKA